MANKKQIYDKIGYIREVKNTGEITLYKGRVKAAFEAAGKVKPKNYKEDMYGWLDFKKDGKNSLYTRYARLLSKYLSENIYACFPEIVLFTENKSKTKYPEVEAYTLDVSIDYEEDAKNALTLTVTVIPGDKDYAGDLLLQYSGDLGLLPYKFWSELIDFCNDWKGTIGENYSLRGKPMGFLKALAKELGLNTLEELYAYKGKLHEVGSSEQEQKGEKRLQKTTPKENTAKEVVKKAGESSKQLEKKTEIVQKPKVSQTTKKEAEVKSSVTQTPSKSKKQQIGMKKLAYYTLGCGKVQRKVYLTQTATGKLDLVGAYTPEKCVLSDKAVAVLQGLFDTKLETPLASEYATKPIRESKKIYNMLRSPQKFKGMGNVVYYRMKIAGKTQTLYLVKTKSGKLDIVGKYDETTCKLSSEDMRVLQERFDSGMGMLKL